MLRYDDPNAPIPPDEDPYRQAMKRQLEQQAAGTGGVLNPPNDRSVPGPQDPVPAPAPPPPPAPAPAPTPAPVGASSSSSSSSSSSTSGGASGSGGVNVGPPPVYTPTPVTTANAGPQSATVTAGNTAITSNVTSNSANTTLTSNTNYQNAIYDAVRAQLDKLSAPIDANSYLIKSQTDAYDIKSARELEQARNALAEQAYAGGDLGTGGYRQSQQRALENAAAARSGFVGNAVKDAETLRQKSLMDALGQGVSAENARNALTSSDTQFNAKLAEDQSQFQQTLQNSKDEFAKTLGYQYDQLNQAQKQFVDAQAWDRERTKLQLDLQKAGMDAQSAAAGAANAIAAQRLEMDRQGELFAQQQWLSTHPAELIAAQNQRAIAEALGYTG